MAGQRVTTTLEFAAVFRAWGKKIINHEAGPEAGRSARSARMPSGGCVRVLSVGSRMFGDPPGSDLAIVTTQCAETVAGGEKVGFGWHLGLARKRPQESPESGILRQGIWRCSRSKNKRE